MTHKSVPKPPPAPCLPDLRDKPLERDHRVRLTDNDLALIVSALRARAAMTTKLRRHRVERLAERLAEMTPGNPKWVLDEFGQTREEEIDADELE